MTPLRDSTAMLGDRAALRTVLAHDGYLYLRGMIPAAELLCARSVVATELATAGWIHDQTGEDLSVRPEALHAARGQVDAMFARVFALEPVHRLAHGEAVLRLMSGLLGDPLLVHPRPFVRLVLPKTTEPVDTTTAAHQDFVSQQGTEDTLT